MTWMVSLLSVNHPASRSVRADKNGEYEFSALPPGEYLVGVNLNGPPDNGAPFPATYYPGTMRRQDAVPIVVGLGTVHEGIDFTLHDPIRPGKLEIRIQDVVGATTTVVCLQDITSPPATPGGTYPQFKRGAPIVIDVLEGSRYRFVAHVERPNGHVESDVFELNGTLGLQILTVTADQRARSHFLGNECGAFSSSRR
jgi:hypothetical protein